MKVCFCSGLRQSESSRVRPAAVVGCLLVAWITESVGQGVGFIEATLSDASGFIAVDLVDPNTLLPINGFAADELGNYAVDALLVASGDTANPVGSVALTGDLGGSLRVGVRIDSVPLGGVVMPGDAFLSIISGQDVSPFIEGGAERVRSTQRTTTSGVAGSPTTSLFTASRAFMATADGKESAVPGVSGSTPIPGLSNFGTQYMCIPPLPPDTLETEFSRIVMQQDIGLFGLTAGANFNATVDSSTVVTREPFSGVPGDYSNNGIVDIADYPVWRDRLGAPIGELLNDPTGLPVGIEQYNLWVSEFGESTPAGGPLHIATAPEPAGQLLFLGVVVACRVRPRHDAGSHSTRTQATGSALWSTL